MEYTDCVVVFLGQSWGKGDDVNEALRIAFKHELPREDRKYQMQAMRIIFPESLPNTDIVEVDGLGHVSFPAGSTVIKSEVIDIPAKLIIAFHAFDYEMDEFVYSGKFDALD